MKLEKRFANYIITESELLTPQANGGKFTTEQRQFILDELSRMANEFGSYNASLIKAIGSKPHLVATKPRNEIA